MAGLPLDPPVRRTERQKGTGRNKIMTEPCSSWGEWDRTWRPVWPATEHSWPTRQPCSSSEKAITMACKGNRLAGVTNAQWLLASIWHQHGDDWSGHWHNVPLAILASV